MRIRTYIAGHRFYPGATKALSTMARGTLLTLQREPDNPHDRNAVAVLDPTCAKLGHVPATDVPPVARVMDLDGVVPTVVFDGGNTITITWEN